MSTKAYILHQVSHRRSLLIAASTGCYDAARASALSGVPRSTVYDWARKGVVVPSVSPVQEKLWSYADLMALRVVAWLRHRKSGNDDGELRASPMASVRAALRKLDELEIDLWSAEMPIRSPLMVDYNGSIFIHDNNHYVDLNGDVTLPGDGSFGLLGPFDVAGVSGPDLVVPRPHLRIVPERVAGEPHVVGTRITTQTLAAMAARGTDLSELAQMYEVRVEAVEEAVQLEEQLAA